MTRENEEVSLERRLVVVTDICSSTTILEDLKQTDNLDEWRNLLIRLKDGLLAEGRALGMELYKFIGDGWILLFPRRVPRAQLCGFLTVLSESFAAQFDASISPLLQQMPSPIGLTFGIDDGELIRVEMNEQVEYLGRAINVASRLQSYTKELGDDPGYKALFSGSSFNLCGPPPAHIMVKSITVKLRNISPANIKCFVFQSYGSPEQTKQSGSVDKTATRSRVETLPQSKDSPNIKLTGSRSLRLAASGTSGQWTVDKFGQHGLVLEFTNEAGTSGSRNVGAIIRALLVYRVGGKEVSRIIGTWVDEFDLPKFRVDGTHRLIVCVTGSSELSAISALGTSRKTVGIGSDQVEISQHNIFPVPSKINLLVRLTNADSGDCLYEQEFLVRTNPLGISPL